MLAYLRLLLLYKWKAYNPLSYRSDGKSKARAIVAYVGFTVLALYLYGVIVFLEMMLFNQFEQMGQASAVWMAALLFSTFITLLYGFFSISGQLFFSRDTAFVAALPISSRATLAVRTLVAALGEMGLTLLLCAPLVIRLGISTGAGVLFYLKAFVACAFVPLIPLSAAMCLSFALIRVSKLWKRREGITTVASFAVAIGAMMLSMASQSMNQTELQGVIISLLLGKGSLANVIAERYPPLQWVNEAMLTSGTQSLMYLLGFVGVSAAAFALVLALFGKGYLRLASRQEEALARVNSSFRQKKAKDKAHTPFRALLGREFKEVLTVPAYATNCLMGVVMFPLMMVIVFVSMQTQNNITNLTAKLVNMIPRDIFFGGMLTLLCLTSSMGVAISTAVSREGSRHDMRKTYPVAGLTFLKAKMVMGMLFNLAAQLTTCAVIWVILPAFWLETIGAFALCQLFSFLWCALALILDVYRPKLAWRSEMEAVKQNINGVLSMLICIGLLAALVLAALLCVKLGAPLKIGIGVAVLLMLIGDVLCAKWLAGKASATYFLR